MSAYLSVAVEHAVGALQVHARFDLQHARAALFGPSGSGKTTLLRVLAGLERPKHGRITLDGRVLVDTSANIFVGAGERGVGLVAQQAALFPHLSVEKNLLYGLQKLDVVERQARMQEAAEILGLRGLLGRMPANLSGGERGRVALARALAPRPRLLLLDEPFAALDDTRRDEIYGELQPFLDTHRIATLLVTHDIAEVWHGTQTVVRVRDGSATETGSPYEMLAGERSHLLERLSAPAPQE